MQEVLKSNSKYEEIINQMKHVFVDNPLYDYMLKRDPFKKK